MNCPSCREEIADNSVYCPRCGERVQPGEQPAQVAEPQDTSVGPEQAAGADTPSGPRTSASAGLQDVLRKRQAAGDDVEKELWTGRYSSKDMIGVWALDALLTIALIAAGLYVRELILWWVILGIVILIWGYPLLVLFYRRLSVRYRLTTQRFFHEQGILRHVTDRIEVIDMDDISFEQSLVQRMVNVGRIQITSSDRSHPELVINGIEDVRKVATMMDDARRAERLRRGLHIEAV